MEPVSQGRRACDRRHSLAAEGEGRMEPVSQGRRACDRRHSPPAEGEGWMEPVSQGRLNAAKRTHKLQNGEVATVVRVLSWSK